MTLMTREQLLAQLAQGESFQQSELSHIDLNGTSLDDAIFIAEKIYCHENYICA